MKCWITLLSGLLGCISTTGCSGGAPRLQTEAVCWAHPDLHKDIYRVQLRQASTSADYVLRGVGIVAPWYDVETVYLRKGEAVGFRRTATGAIVAVAGQREIVLQPQFVALAKDEGLTRRDATGVVAPHYHFEWSRHTTRGERAVEVAIRIALLPLMLGGAMGGGP